MEGPGCPVTAARQAFDRHLPALMQTMRKDLCSSVADCQTVHKDADIPCVRASATPRVLRDFLHVGAPVHEERSTDEVQKIIDQSYEHDTYDSMSYLRNLAQQRRKSVGENV